MGAPREDCDFCVRISNPEYRQSAYDFMLLEKTADFHVVVALGALGPGHIMIVSNQHRSSVAQLPDGARLGLESLIAKWRAQLSVRWGDDVILIEHGSSRQIASGACIFHAHIQLLPSRLGGSLIDADMRRVASFKELARAYSRQGYLLIGLGGELWVMPDPGVKSQHFRRLICQLQDRASEWDYLVYPQVGCMEQTYRELGLLTSP